MKVKLLRHTIRGSGAAADDLRMLDTLLSEIDEAEVSELVAALRAPVGKLAATLSKRRKAIEEAGTLVASFVTELERTRWDNTAFEAVVDRMKKNKAIKLSEAAQIANSFLGEAKSFKSKPEAAKAILKRQIGDKRSSDRKTGASDLF